jgi:hypothetical protein
MEDAIDRASLIVEAFSWIGLAAGVLLLVLGYVRKAMHRGWKKALGVAVLDANGDLAYRWLGDDGVIYDAPVEHGDEAGIPEPGDDITVYVNPRDPSVGRIDDPAHEGRALRITGWILLAVGVLSAATGVILLFIAG